MTTQDKIKVIAEYDGWELRGEPEFAPPYKIWIKHLPQGTKMIPYISPSGKEYDDWAKEMKYVTSMDWLHPAAINVLNNLISKFNISTKFDTYVCASDHIGWIKKSMYKTTINGEYTDLFNAVYDGIVFLKSKK
jgi:hypothetical protein